MKILGGETSVNRNRGGEASFFDVLHFVVTNCLHIGIDAKVSRIQRQIQITARRTNHRLCRVSAAGNLLIELPQQDANRDR